MEQKRLEKFKTTLQRWLQQLRRSAAERQREGARDQTAYGKDEGDRASSSHEKELLLLRSSHTRNVVKEIEAALMRIDEGAFGNCLNCGQGIDAKRLEAIPWTRYCITCQELIEEQR